MSDTTHDHEHDHDHSHRHGTVDPAIVGSERGNLGAVAAAGVLGFLGNEAVAVFRIRVGRQIGSAALIADGYHARTDGLTSLAVVGGAAGVALGAPIADPIVGLAISLVILRIVWQAAKSIGERMLDGMDPAVTEQIRQAASSADQVQAVGEVRARWLGHSISAEVEVEVAVEDDRTMLQSRDVSERVAEALRRDVEFMGDAIVRVEPRSRVVPSPP